MIVQTQDGNGNVIEEYGTAEPARKSIWTKMEILNKLNPARRRQIMDAEAAGDQDARDFLFILRLVDFIDNNDPPDGWESSLDGMAANSALDLITQAMVDNFLDR